MYLCAIELILLKMSKIKAVFVSKLALLFSFVSIDKSKNINNIINLKKASAQDIETNRCKQYEYVA